MFVMQLVILQLTSSIHASGSSILPQKLPQSTSLHLPQLVPLTLSKVMATTEEPCATQANWVQILGWYYELLLLLPLAASVLWKARTTVVPEVKW